MTRRTYIERRSYSARVMRFRKAVYEPREKMTNGCRVLLLRLSDDMDATLKVSVPRTVLAADLGVAPARITESIALAKELGFLDTVRRARQHITAVYAGLIPLSEVRPNVPLDECSEVRPPEPTEVRPAVPLGDIQRYALPMPQEEVETAGIGTAIRGAVADEERSNEETDLMPSPSLAALVAPTSDCPHGIPWGMYPEPWLDALKDPPVCPECRREAIKSREHRRTA